MLKTGLIALGVLAMTSTFSGSVAQTADNSDLTAEQLEGLFAKQKTRGLVLAPATGTASPATNEQAAAPATQTAPAAVTYVELDKSEQINIQISFDFDSAALRSDQKPKLSALCQAMQNVDVQVFRIVGHTDSSGSASYNERLSLLRAQEVKRHMVSDCGLAETRLEAVGVGEQFPFDQNNPRADKNRRVEFQALS